MATPKARKPKARSPQGAELAETVKILSRSDSAGIAELRSLKGLLETVSQSKAAMSTDKVAGLSAEAWHSGTFNAAARKAGDFKTTATTGTDGGFVNDPRVDIRVSQGDKVIAEAQVKCCRSTGRSAAEVSKPRYEGTQRVVPAGQGKAARKLLLDKAQANATSANPRRLAKGLARHEAAGKVTEQLSAGGHKSRKLSHAEATKLAKGDMSQVAQLIVRETLVSAAVNGAKAGALFSGGASAVTAGRAAFKGTISAKQALKTVVVDTAAGGARSAATAVVAEGVKVAAKKSLSSAAAGVVSRGSAPMAVAGCVVDIVHDAYKGRLTPKSAARNATRASLAWAGAEGGAMLGTAIFPGVGIAIGAFVGGCLGGTLANAITA